MSAEGGGQNVRPASEFISRRWIHPDLYIGSFDGCMSNNAPERGGWKPLINLDPTPYFPNGGFSPVHIDNCIADAIKSLWEAGIWTGGSCCGHGRDGVKPSVVLANWQDGERAVEVLANEGRRWEIKAWVLRDVPATDAGERVCPDCRAERADFEASGDSNHGSWLPTCPNCGSKADPVPALSARPESAGGQ